MMRWGKRSERPRTPQPMVTAPVGENLTIRLTPGFEGTVTVRPDGTTCVTAPAGAWRFLETGAPAAGRGRKS